MAYGLLGMYYLFSGYFHGVRVAANKPGTSEKFRSAGQVFKTRLPSIHDAATRKNVSLMVKHMELRFAGKTAGTFKPWAVLVLKNSKFLEQHLFGISSERVDPPLQDLDQAADAMRRVIDVAVCGQSLARATRGFLRSRRSPCMSEASSFH